MTKSISWVGWGQRISSLAGLALVLYVAYYTYSLVIAKDRMTEVCNQIKPGMTIVQLIKLSEEHGLGHRNLLPKTKLVYLAEARSFGRHACRVELDDGIVNSATYNYAD